MHRTNDEPTTFSPNPKPQKTNSVASIPVFQSRLFPANEGMDSFFVDGSRLLCYAHKVRNVQRTDRLPISVADACNADDDNSHESDRPNEKVDQRSDKKTKERRTAATATSATMML